MGLSRVPHTPACIAEEVNEFAQLPKAKRDDLKRKYQEEQKQKADTDRGGSGEPRPKEEIEIELKEEFESFPEEVQKRRYRPPEACHKDLNHT